MRIRYTYVGFPEDIDTLREITRRHEITMQTDYDMTADAFEITITYVGEIA